MFFFFFSTGEVKPRGHTPLWDFPSCLLRWQGIREKSQRLPEVRLSREEYEICSCERFSRFIPVLWDGDTANRNPCTPQEFTQSRMVNKSQWTAQPTFTTVPSRGAAQDAPHVHSPRQEEDQSEDAVSEGSPGLMPGLMNPNFCWGSQMVGRTAWTHRHSLACAGRFESHLIWVSSPEWDLWPQDGSGITTEP